LGLGSAGGGNGATPGNPNVQLSGISGATNTGGGGGGSSDYGVTATTPANGGSGIVILRYPSYLAPATSTTGSPETYVTGFWRVYRFIASGTITF
jgi:hypothetical protein